MRSQWLLASLIGLATLFFALSIVRWLAPGLLGIPPDLQIVRLAEEKPAFYENVFRAEHEGAGSTPDRRGKPAGDGRLAASRQAADGDQVRRLALEKTMRQLEVGDSLFTPCGCVGVTWAAPDRGRGDVGSDGGTA